MSWTLDVIIALIIGLTVYSAAKNGFIKTAISALSFVIAIVLTIALASPVSEYIKQTPVATTVEEATKGKIEEILSESTLNLDALVDGASEEFNNLAALAGFEKAELSEWFDTTVTDAMGLEAAISTLAEKIAEPIIDTVAFIISIIIIFIGSQIILSILSFVLDKIARLPILKSFNKAFGIALGVVLAIVRVCLFCFVVSYLIENASFLNSDFIANLNPDSTLLFKIFSQIDIFSFFVK